MKTQIVKLGVLALLVVITGCNARSAEQQFKPVADPLTMQPAPPIPEAPAEVEGADAGQNMAAQTPVVSSVDFVPSKNLADVIKLVRGGVSDDLLRTFIDNTQGSFALGAAGIVYLHDLGVSDQLINLILQHDHQPLLVAQTTVDTAVAPRPVAVQETQPEATAVVVVEQPSPVTVNYFYSSLSPYGAWIEVDGYGRCWQPTIVYTQRDWRPYCDNGHWVYSNHGWYWVSDYSWGVTFHYGRWFCHPRRGWCWMPDTMWGPAWVSWRQSSDYCGWAPLPPQTVWVSGMGLTYHGAAVSVGFDFGLSSSCYTMVPRSFFCDRRPYRHALPHSQVTQIINNTTVINNYSVGGRGGAFNHGVGSGSEFPNRRPTADNRRDNHPDGPVIPVQNSRPDHDRQVRNPSVPAQTIPATQPVTTTQPNQMPANRTPGRGNGDGSIRRFPGSGTPMPRPTEAAVPAVQPVAVPNVPVASPVVQPSVPAIEPLVIGRGQSGRSLPGRNGPEQNFPNSRRADDASQRILLERAPNAPTVQPQVPPFVATITPSIPTPAVQPQVNPWPRVQPAPANPNRGTVHSPPYVPPQARVQSGNDQVLRPKIELPVMSVPTRPSMPVQPVNRIQSQPSYPPAPVVVNMPQSRISQPGISEAEGKKRSDELGRGWSGNGPRR